MSVMSKEGTKAELVFSGTLDQHLFAWYLEFWLFPVWNKDKILVLDNCSVHHSKLVTETIDRLGINVLFLPPYSPDFNPIELLWAWVKTFLKKTKARTQELLIDGISKALNLVNQELLYNWFEHCGFYL